jgi:hypothetical protein
MQNRSRHDLGLELVALRQQVGVLKRKNPRPKLSRWDRLFWFGLRRWWSKWARVRDALRKETPTARVVERRPDATAKVVGVPRVGGLHHRDNTQKVCETNRCQLLQVKLQ